MDLFKLFGTIVINSDDADEAIRKTRDEAKDSGNSITAAFKKVGSAVVAYFAADRIAQFGASCLQAAADANAMSSQFQQVFSNYAVEAQNSLVAVADAAGISTNRMKGSFTQIAAFAKTTGMETADALALSERAIVAVADSAAFYDRTLEETTDSLQSFLKGNYENDAALGLSCTETTRNAAANKLYGKSFIELSEAQKQLTLLQMVEDANAASGALGQAARESNTWTNQIGNLKQAWTDFSAMIGSNFLPTAISVVAKLQETVTWLTNNEATVKKVATGIGILTAAIIAHNAVLKIQAIGIAAATTASGAQAIMMGTTTTALGLHTVATNIATAATSAFGAVTAFLASPLALVVLAVGSLTAGIIKLAKAQDDTIAAMAGTAETSAEAAANVENLKSQIEALEATDPAFWSDMQQTEYDNLRLALAEAQAQYDALKAAEEGAAESATLPAEAVSQSTQETIDSMNNLLASYQETYTQIFENVGQWFEPFEAAKTTVTTNVNDMMAAMQSQIDFNNTYAQNLQTLADYGLGTLASAFQSSGAEGSAYAATIVAAVEQAGGATSAGGQEIINNFAELQAGVAESRGELAESMTAMSGEFDAALSAMVDSLSASVDGLDKSAEAYAAAMSTLGEYLAGVNAQTPEILAAMTALGQQITAALQAGIGVVTVPTVTAGVGMTGRSAAVGQYATGLDYVPYDNFPAYLHEGEMVVPAGQADFLRAGGFAQATSEQNATIVAVLSQILSAVQNVDISNAFDGVALNVNSREFARMVKAVN